ncbi:MAG: AraC family transcriptional regulator [Lachnospiraceae bacterium]
MTPYQEVKPQPHGGVTYKEGIYFHSPSNFAKEYLYYVLFGGLYTCNEHYEINRPYYPVFLLIRITKGNLHFNYLDSTFTAKTGDVVLLDCKKPHRYWADSLVTFQWFHFDGCSSQAYFDMLSARFGTCFSEKTGLYFTFNSILDELKSGTPDDHKCSVSIHDILSVLAESDKRLESSSVQKARQFIQEHFKENISVPDIASYVSLNSFYFSKLFKKTTGMPPHQYLTGLRIKYAKLLLAETSYGISHIAITCGFSHEMHFIRSFKTNASITPTQFRKYFDSSGFRD